MNKWGAGVALFTVFAFFLVTVFQLHPIGEPSRTEMDTYFIENSQPELGTNNVVTSIVFDYRGFDTLGEATILFAAVTSVFMVFWRRVR
jgi:multisubunit Na+/H+ antiporter MnhB subunit